MNIRQITIAPNRGGRKDDVDEWMTDLSIMSVLHLQHVFSSTILLS